MGQKPERLDDRDLCRLPSESQPQSPSETAPPEDARLNTRLLDRLWTRMSEIYGHRWVSSFGAAPSDTWARGLAGFTGEKLARGLNACMASCDPWPPTLTQFRDLCLTIPGQPSNEDAWQEALAVARRWKSPADCSSRVVWHALSQIGDFTHLDEEVLRKRFKHNYAQAKAQFAQGGDLAPIPQPLPAPRDVSSVEQMSPERRAAMLAEVDAKLAAAGHRRAHA